MKRNLCIVFLAAVIVTVGLLVNGQMAQEAHEDSCAVKGAPVSDSVASPQAQMIDDFNYATGQLTDSTGGANVSGGVWVTNTGTGNFLQVSAGSLSYTGYPSSGVGNKLEIISTTASAEDTYRNFPTQTAGTTYAAFMVNVANTTGLAANSSTTGDYFAGFISSGSTTAFVNRVTIRAGTVANTYQLGLRATGNAGNVQIFSAVDLPVGTTALVVISYQIVAGATNDVTNLWVNPVITSPEPAPTLTQVSAADNADVGRFFIRQGNAGTPNASLDGIRVGANWAQLITGLPTPPKLFETWLKGSNENPPNASTGRGYGRVALNDAETQITASVYWEGLGSNTTLGHIHGPAPTTANAGVIFDMTPPTGATSGVAENRVFAVTPQQVADLKAGLWYFNIHSVNIGAGEIRGQLAVARAPVDFNGDGKTDYSVVRDSGGQRIWYNLINGPNTATGIAWGAGGDVVTPEDFDGDGRTDVAVWRGGAQGRFFVINSSNGTATVVNFGTSGDDPTVVGDYDRDGKADFAIFRAGNGHWWYMRSTIGGSACSAAAQNCNDVLHGQPGDVPAPGDYDGDGRNDFAVRRSEATLGRFWFLTAALVTSNVQFGTNDDLIIPGDYDGDGKTDIAIARAQAGQGSWWWRPSGGGADVNVLWGDSSVDEVVHGDYDGDGKTEPAVWRNGSFLIRGSLSGPFGTQWGAAGDFPTASFNGHGN